MAPSPTVIALIAVIAAVVAIVANVAGLVSIRRTDRAIARVLRPPILSPPIPSPAPEQHNSEELTTADRLANLHQLVKLLGVTTGRGFDDPGVRLAMIVVGQAASEEMRRTLEEWSQHNEAVLIRYASGEITQQAALAELSALLGAPAGATPQQLLERMRDWARRAGVDEKAANRVYDVISERLNGEDAEPKIH
jgi:hypothetical protein